MASYLPGYRPDMTRMLTARTATDRAGLLVAHLTDGMRVIDIGCGPGTITAGLATPHGVALGVDVALPQLRQARHRPVAAGRAEALPVGTATVDAVLAHAVFEHLPAPAPVLAETHRVLRPNGLLAVSSSDWSAAVIHPRTPAVDHALRSYWQQRRHTGTDPFAGRELAGHIRSAGYTIAAERRTYRVDMTYTGLAAYLRDRLTDPSAVRAAAEWADGGPGEFTQCWVDVLAIRSTSC